LSRTCDSVIVIEPITLSNISVFKAVRLRALKDSPGAFGSTYARESEFEDAEWTNRALRWNGERGVGFVALDGDTGCGIAGAFLDPEVPLQAQLVSMWTAPTHRRHGIGRQLVNEVDNWARKSGARTLCLMVTSNNETAQRFYARLGFARTGRTEPYPNDPIVVEYEMSRSIESASSSSI
jgi:ribosomal protein S18 acetylase RimI-like enzyme